MFEKHKGNLIKNRLQFAKIKNESHTIAEWRSDNQLVHWCMMYSPQRVFEFHDVHEMYAVDDGLCLTKKTPCIRKLIKWKILYWRTNRGSVCNDVYPDDGLIGEHWDDEHLVDSHFDNQLLEIDELMLVLAYYVVVDDKNRNPMKRPHCITISKFNVITTNNGINLQRKNILTIQLWIHLYGSHMPENVYRSKNAFQSKKYRKDSFYYILYWWAFHYCIWFVFGFWLGSILSFFKNFFVCI